MVLKKYNIKFNDDLADRIIKEIFYSFPSKNLDNVYVKMMQNSYPPRWLQPVVENVQTVLQRPLHRYWLNAMPTNSKIGWHDHWKNDEVAVLYIQIPDNDTPIEFDIDSKIISVTPYPGLLLRFPGSVSHRVLENKNKDYRISIAFDLL